jgi:hypothetical protein
MGNRDPTELLSRVLALNYLKETLLKLRKRYSLRNHTMVSAFLDHFSQTSATTAVDYNSWMKKHKQSLNIQHSTTPLRHSRQTKKNTPVRPQPRKETEETPKSFEPVLISLGNDAEPTTSSESSDSTEGQDLQEIDLS